MVDSSYNDFLELYFQEMTEQPFLTRKIKLFSILSKNHIKSKFIIQKIATESTSYTLNLNFILKIEKI